MAEFAVTKKKILEDRKKEADDFLCLSQRDTDMLLGILKKYDPINLVDLLVYKIHLRRKAQKKSKSSDLILEYHVQHLQALLLTIKEDNWGKLRVTPDAMKKVESALRRLSRRKLKEFIASNKFDIFRPEELDNEEIRNKYNNQRILLNRSHNIQISQKDVSYEFMDNNLGKLMFPLEECFFESYGFSYLNLVSVLKALREIFDENLKSGVEIKTLFTVSQVSSLVDLDHKTTTRVLNSISCFSGDRHNEETSKLVTNNFVWECPGIKLKTKNYFFPNPVIRSNLVYRILDRFGRERFPDPWYKRRGEFLEEQLESAIKPALPQAKVTRNAKWKEGKPDLLVIQDRVVLIFEAKSHRALDKNISKLVVSPSHQLKKLRMCIERAKRGEEECIEEVEKIGINPKKVERIITVSVTLENLFGLENSEDLLQNKGVLKDTDFESLSPSISISDLKETVERLMSPLLIYHYLSNPSNFKKIDTYGNEIDRISEYQEKIFEDKKSWLGLINYPFHKQIKEHRVSPYEVIVFLEKYQPEGWIHLGMNLLDVILKRNNKKSLSTPEEGNFKRQE